MLKHYTGVLPEVRESRTMDKVLKALTQAADGVFAVS